MQEGGGADFTLSCYRLQAPVTEKPRSYETVKREIEHVQKKTELCKESVQKN